MDGTRSKSPRAIRGRRRLLPSRPLAVGSTHPRGALRRRLAYRDMPTQSRGHGTQKFGCDGALLLLSGFLLIRLIRRNPERLFSLATSAADLGGACRVFNSFLLNRAIPPGVIARQSKAWGSITWTWNGMLEQAPVTEGRRGAAEFRVSREWADPLSRSVQPDSSRCPIWTTCPVQTDRTDSPYLAAMGCPS